MSSNTPHYVALALQLTCPTVNTLSDAETREAMLAYIARMGRHLAGSKALIGSDVKLVVLPEYFMTGYPLGETIPGWAKKAAIAPNGPEYEALSRVAQQSGVFLSGNAYETDANFPEIYFQTCFIIDPAGDVVLRYRRLISMFAPTPHDVWDRYLDLYGVEAVFPVADTSIGKLACCASEEILYPEICRAHAVRGAEVILHSTSEVASTSLTPKDIAKRARAIENIVYVVSCNTGGIADSPIPMNSVDSMSKIVDFHGHVLASATIGESMVANAELDLAALRRYRRRPGMPNVLARQRLELFADTYSGRSIYPGNTLLDSNGEHVVPERAHFVETQRQTIESLIEQELI
ncbi:MAG: nitrilase-related carbon-nitrogen hydrolase [Pseudomonadota bacterium]